MQGKFLYAFGGALVVPMLISACAGRQAPPETTSTELGNPSQQQSLNCRIDGLVQQDLARLRDAGMPIKVAVSRVNTQYQGLVSTMDERAAVDLALAHRDAAAQFVYAHKNLQPATVRYVGNSACLMAPAGTYPAPKLGPLAKAAEACQQANVQNDDEASLKTCINTQAVQLQGP